jgi:hypothetical protein
MEIPSLFIYLAKVTACFILLYGFYLLLLAKQKRPVANRFVLLAAIVVSLVLPLLSVSYTVTKVVDIATSTNQAVGPNFKSTGITDANNLDEASAVGNYEKPPVNSLFLNVQFWLIAYLSVVALLALRLVWQVARFVLLLLKSARLDFVGSTKVWVCDSWGQTFSFFGLIVFSAKDFRNPNRHLLLQHELVHVHQLHSFDLLLAELFAVVFWFNPLAYWYKRSLAEVHEFIADNSVVRRGADSIQYKQLILDCVSTTVAPRVANSFSAKLLKNRFAMLTNVNETRGIYGYLLLVPIAAVLFGLFSFTLEHKVEYVQPYEAESVEPLAVEDEPLTTHGASIGDEVEVKNEGDVEKLAEPQTGVQDRSGTEVMVSELSASDSTILYKRLDGALDDGLEKVMSAFQKPETDLFFGNLVLGSNTTFTILATAFGDEMPRFVLTSKENGSVVKPTAEQKTSELVKKTYLVKKAGEYNVKLSNSHKLSEVLYYLALPKDANGEVDFGFRVKGKTVYLKEKESNTTATIDALRIVSEDKSEDDVTIFSYLTQMIDEDVTEDDGKGFVIETKNLEFSVDRSEPGNPDYLGVLIKYEDSSASDIKINSNIFDTNLKRVGEDATSWPLSYLHKSMNYPKLYKPKRQNPDVVEVEFNLSEKGEIADVMVTKGINPEVDAELVRVVSQMPGWQAEKPYGKPVSAKVTMGFCLVKK